MREKDTERDRDREGEEDREKERESRKSYQKAQQKQPKSVGPEIHNITSTTAFSQQRLYMEPLSYGQSINRYI